MNLKDTTPRSARENLDILSPAIFNQLELSACTGAHWRTVAGWLGKEQQNPGNNDHKRALGELAAIAIFLKNELSFTNEEIQEYFTTPHIDAETYELTTMSDIFREEQKAPFIISKAIECSIDADK